MNEVMKSLIMTFAASALFSGAVLPANAQYMGSDSHEPKVVQVSESDNAKDLRKNHVFLTNPECSSNTTVDPHTASTNEASDAVMLQGVNTAGTVRINMLANLEALVNVCANGAEIICFIWGAVLLWACFRKLNTPGIAARSFAFALVPIILGACTPASLNWFIAAARDANLFS